MNNNMNPKQLNALLQMAGKQLGTNPATLKAKLEQGQLDEMMRGLSPQQMANLQQVLSNPQAIQSLLNSAQARDLMNRLTGGK